MTCDDCDRILLFGGSSEHNVALNDTWTYDGADWVEH
jgi:hypothetical protein